MIYLLEGMEQVLHFFFSKDSFNIYLSKRDENLNLNEHTYSYVLKRELKIYQRERERERERDSKSEKLSFDIY